MNRKPARPPRPVEWLLHLMSKSGEEYSAKGDFQEEFSSILEDRGRLFAVAWYIFQILIYFPTYMKNSIPWSFIMFRNHFKTAFRNLRKNKGYAFINIAGLAMGMTVCILILLWVQNELSFDRFHTKSNRIYRVCFSDLWSGKRVRFSATPTGIGPYLEKDFPEVMDSTRFYRISDALVRAGDKKFIEEQIYLADPSLFEIFSFPFVKGDPQSALTEPRSMVLSESTAEKFFGSADPVGKILTIDSDRDFKVTGVFKNIPHNSHLRFDILGPFEFLEEMGVDLDMWTNWSYYTYLLMHPESGTIDDNRLTEYYLSHVNGFDNIQMHLLPLKDIHLRSNTTGGIGADGDIKYVYIFSLIALFVLIIACINFMNLSTAESGIRAKEIGIRKILGARREQIIRQFYSESFLQALIGLFIGLGLVAALLPLFNKVTAKSLSLDLTGNWIICLMLAGIAIFTGFMSGSYPALYLSSLNPVSGIKGMRTLRAGNRAAFRRSLVVVQFSLTIIMMIATVIVYNQLHFIREKKMGFDQEHLAVMRLTEALKDRKAAFKQSVLHSPGVLNAAYAHSWQFHGMRSDLLRGGTPDKNVRLFLNNVDEDYLETFGMEMADGRFFSREFSEDRNNIILNETAVEAIGLKDPVGSSINWRGKSRTVVGVIKDFHFETLNRNIGALCLLSPGSGFRYLFIRVSPQNLDATLPSLRAAWEAFEPLHPFHYQFFDDDFDSLYRSEQRIGTIFRYFAFLAIFISCLGLFGLAAFTAVLRTKEIGVRRVLGASFLEIIVLLTKEFTKWVLAANMIAWPIAYYVMNKWLQNFAYRAKLNIGIFLGTAGLALLISLITVSFHSIKAATTGPVKSLRYE